MGLMRHPAFVLAIAWIVVVGVDRLRRSARLPSPVAGVHVAVVASVASIVLYGAIVLWYTLRRSYFDAAEPTITAVAAVFAAGRPLYPALDAPERYAHIYGPALFIAHAGAFVLGGTTIVASKAVGALAALSSVALGYGISHRRAGAAATLIVTGVSTLIYMYFSNATFWTRPDPLLILCSTVALAGALIRRASIASVVLGLAAGVAINLKVTGPIYLFPACALAFSTHGARVFRGAAAIAVAVAVGPFLLPNVSLSHYWDYLQLSARNGLVARRVLDNAEWGAFLLAPIAVTWWGSHTAPRGRDTRWLLTSLTAAVAAVVVAGAKPGGGPFHLLPFVPVGAYAVLSAPLGVWSHPGPARLGIAFAVAALAMAVPQQRIFLETVAGRRLEPAITEINRFADARPSKRVAVGYAGTSYLSHARPELVFRSGDYLIDAPAVQEHGLSGLPLPEATIRAIADCRFDYWLLPRDAAPFAVPNAYHPDGPPAVFPDEFRSVFVTRYARVGHAGQFDVWECRSRARGGSN